MIDNSTSTIVPNTAAVFLSGKTKTLSPSIYDAAGVPNNQSNTDIAIMEGTISSRYSPIRLLTNNNSNGARSMVVINANGNLKNNNNNHTVRNFNNTSSCTTTNVTNSTTIIPSVCISGQGDNTMVSQSSLLPVNWHYTCPTTNTVASASSIYQETMPKDISPPPTTTSTIKCRNKYSAEFPLTNCQQDEQQQQQPNNCGKNKMKPRQLQRSRFRTMPITLEEFREADEEQYLKQQKEAKKTEDSEDDDAFSDDQEQPNNRGHFRQKSWTFSMGTGHTLNNRRSPSPNRKLSAPPRMWSPNLHTIPCTRNTLNWRPLSQESLLNLNTIATLPTIPEERRLLNSPLTPSFDQNIANQFGGQPNENSEVKAV